MKKRILLVGSLLVFGLMSQSCATGRVDNNFKNVGILQIATHEALDLARKGFIETLNANGFVEGKNINFTIQNPEGDASKQNSIAKSLVLANDLVFGISTGSAQALKSQAIDIEKDLPILFSAVTDPKAAKLVPSSEYENITGTSDEGDTAKNVSLFSHFNFIKNIACLYNSAESNSQIQKDECKTACANFNLKYVDAGITSATQLKSTLQSLVAKGVNGIFIPTDNMIAENIASIKELAIDNKIVLVCADTSIVKNGGSLGYGVDYFGLGKQTGVIASKILKGEKDAKDIPFEKSSSFSLEINETFFKDSGIELPNDLK
jgi:putative ABC transport system substrate-binding protein